jgi:hypothetical protein
LCCPSLARSLRPWLELVDMLFETTGNYRDLDAYEEEFVEYFLPYVKDWDSLETIKANAAARLDCGITSLVWLNELNEALVKATMGSRQCQERDGCSCTHVIQSLLDEAYNK